MVLCEASIRIYVKVLYLLIAVLSNCLMVMFWLKNELPTFVHPNSTCVNVKLYSVFKASFFALLPFLH